MFLEPCHLTRRGELGSFGSDLISLWCYVSPDARVLFLHLARFEGEEVKGAPLCNLSVWEPRFGGFTWGWGPGWYHQVPVMGTRKHQLPPNSIWKTQVLAQSAADEKNHLLASLCLGVPALSPGRTSYPNLAYGPPK